MNDQQTFVEETVALISDIEQQVTAGTVELPAEEWANLYRDLEEARDLLAQTGDDIDMDDLAGLIVAAIEENDTLADHFADRLAELTSGTMEVARVLEKSTTPPILMNTMTEFLTNVTQVVEKQANDDEQNSGTRSSHDEEAKQVPK